MGIISAELRALPQTGNPIFLNFDEKVNLFIGPNASGKTAILREIGNAFSSAAQGDNPTLNINENFNEALHLYIPAIRVSLGEGDIPHPRYQFDETKPIRIGRKAFFKVFESRGQLVGSLPSTYDGLEFGYVDNPDEYLAPISPVGYIIDALREKRLTGLPITEAAWDAIHEFVNMEMPLDELKQIEGQEDPGFFEAVRLDDDLINALENFRSQRLSNAAAKLSGNTESRFFEGRDVDAVLDLFRRLAEIRELDWDNRYTKLMNVGYSCAKAICPETIQGDLPHVIRSRIRSGVGILTGDDTSGGRYGQRPLPLGVLSSGTQGTLLWVWALAVAMAAHYHWDSNWEKRPAILLIDEIENHLHPTWQRRVIPALLDHFPGLQIFATTHSPFVVAGLKAGQVHLLRRDENGVTATTNTEDVIGWTADEILRNMMGVDDPTDDATAAHARELRQLRQEPPRSNPEAEARRQATDARIAPTSRPRSARRRPNGGSARIV